MSSFYELQKQGRANKIQDPMRNTKVGPYLTGKFELLNNYNVLELYARFVPPFPYHVPSFMITLFFLYGLVMDLLH
jgi:hypothetical protein